MKTTAEEKRRDKKMTTSQGVAPVAAPSYQVIIIWHNVQRVSGDDLIGR